MGDVAELRACREQQAEELETLEAIYGASLERLGDNSFHFTHNLPAQRDAPATFTVTYPPLYPRESPKVSISVAGLPPAAVERAVEHVMEALPSLTGSPCVFQLTALLEEGFEEGAPLLGPGASGAEGGRTESAPAAAPAQPEAEINYGMLPGDPTTRESFYAWWDVFRRARGIVLESDPEYIAKQANLRPSGRQYWLEKLGSGAALVEEEV